MTTKWLRGCDGGGRLFTVGVDGAKRRGYFPDVEGEVLRSVRSGAWSLGARIGRSLSPLSMLVRYSYEEGDDVGDVDAWFENYEARRVATSTREPGLYFPRVYLGTESPDLKETGQLDAWLSATRSARGIFERLRELLFTVEPREANQAAFGHAFRHLLLLACTDVEAAWRGVFEENHRPPPTNGYWTARDYRDLCPIMRLDEYGVRLSAHPGYPIVRPFEAWKRGTGLPWYQAYNATKHDREGAIHQATLAHVVEACAGLFIMIHAQFGPRGRSQDYFHADEFSLVEEPKAIAEWYIRPLPSLDEEPDPENWPTWTRATLPWRKVKGGKKGRKR